MPIFRSRNGKHTPKLNNLVCKKPLIEFFDNVRTLPSQIIPLIWIRTKVIKLLCPVSPPPFRSISYRETY